MKIFMYTDCTISKDCVFYVWLWSTTGTRAAIFGHPYVEDDCGPESFLSSDIFLLSSFLFFICAICCVWSCFVQSCQYHKTFRTQNQPMFGSITASQTSVQIVFFLFCFVFFCFLFFQEGNKISWNWTVPRVFVYDF